MLFIKMTVVPLCRLEDRIRSVLPSSKSDGGGALDSIGGLGGALKLLFFLLYNLYLFYAVYHYFSTAEEGEGVQWCDGLGFLVIVTIIVYSSMIYFRVVKPAVER